MFQAMLSHVQERCFLFREANVGLARRGRPELRRRTPAAREVVGGVRRGAARRRRTTQKKLDDARKKGQV
jgi:hypothetical protein